MALTRFTSNLPPSNAIKPNLIKKIDSNFSTDLIYNCNDVWMYEVMMCAVWSNASLRLGVFVHTRFSDRRLKMLTKQYDTSILSQ